jgi:hypothetical protein
MIYIEDQAFSPPYDLAPPPPPTPSPVSKLYRRHTERLRKRGKGGADCGGAKSYDGNKAWSSISPSILFGTESPTPPPPLYLTHYLLHIINDLLL